MERRTSASRDHATRAAAPVALEVIARYVQALATRDSEAMNALRASDYILDWVHGDAFEDRPLTAEQTRAFWPAWFRAFLEMDYEVTRTIAGDSVVVTQWVFTGTHSHPLGPPVFDSPLPASGRTIRIRGVSIYDVDGGRIQRETTYLDLATLMVELGVEL